MRTNMKLIAALGMAGVSLAACGSSNAAAKGGSQTATNQAVAAGVKSVATTTTTVAARPPANAPVGFNAAKTEFVLPHNLGYLPGPELALAKADPKYAAGLANLADWVEFPGQALADPKTWHGNTFLGPKGPKLITVGMWLYMGSYGSSPTSPAFNNLENDKTGMAILNQVQYPFVTPVLHSTSVRINDSTLHNMHPNAGFSVSAPVFDTLVAPSALEDQAAPVGTLKTPSGTLPAFCVPVPEAYLLKNKVVNIPSKNFPVITAGPSTIFAGTLPANPSQTKQYDKGAPSCAGFN